MVYERGEMPINERAGARGTGKMAHDEPRSEEIELDVPSVRPVISVAIDDVALAALRNHVDPEPRCSLCETRLAEQGAASTGLFMWSRGDDVRFEEPPLCAGCARDIGLAAFLHWSAEEELED